ncbi:hypothetical protein TNCV_1921951 [Trichonephila clavipes]|nr:hypothetical protein TNCV_1921951 [Trichonephila clavipes]
MEEQVSLYSMARSHSDPHFKTWKSPKNPQLSTDSTHELPFVRHSERMVNARLVYQLEKNKYIPLFQSGFRKGRSTLDNIITLENKMRNAFVRGII